MNLCLPFSVYNSETGFISIEEVTQWRNLKLCLPGSGAL